MLTLLSNRDRSVRTLPMTAKRSAVMNVSIAGVVDNMVLTGRRHCSLNVGAIDLPSDRFVIDIPLLLFRGLEFPTTSLWLQHPSERAHTTLTSSSHPLSCRRLSSQLDPPSPFQVI